MVPGTERVGRATCRLGQRHHTLTLVKYAKEDRQVNKQDDGIMLNEDELLVI